MVQNIGREVGTLEPRGDKFCGQVCHGYSISGYRIVCLSCLRSPWLDARSSQYFRLVAQNFRCYPRNIQRLPDTVQSMTITLDSGSPKDLCCKPTLPLGLSALLRVKTPQTLMK